MGVLHLSFLNYALICVLSSFAIFLKMKKELVALFLCLTYVFLLLNVL